MRMKSQQVVCPQIFRLRAESTRDSRILHVLYIGKGITSGKHMEHTVDQSAQTWKGNKKKVKQNFRSVEHQARGEHPVASPHGVQPTNPTHSWPQVVTTRDCRASSGLDLRSSTAGGCCSFPQPYTLGGTHNKSTMFHKFHSVTARIMYVWPVFYYPATWAATHHLPRICFHSGGCYYARHLSRLKIVPSSLPHATTFWLI